MRVSKSRITALEKKVRMTAEERESLESERQAREARYIKEFERFKAYLTREEFDAWKRNEEAFNKRINEPGIFWTKGPTQEQLEAAKRRAWDAMSDEARDRYNNRHYAYAAVYGPRIMAHAVRLMEKDPAWGSEADYMGLIEIYLDQVTKELGFDSHGNSYPYDPTEKRYTDE